MEHSFDIDIAKRYGIPAAVLLKNIHFWIEKNRANEQNFYDGYYWTYNSKKAFAELFPYLTSRQIDYALQKLIDDGLIITGNYNKVAYDRTLWYAITKLGYSILQNCEMEATKMENGKPEIVQPIPDINSNKTPNKNTDSKEPKRKNFVPPTLEEVRAYCIERKNNVDAERFIDYYTANGWRVGKNRMKDWRAAVRTWERNGYSEKKTQETEKTFDTGEFFDLALRKTYGKSPRAVLERGVVGRSEEKAKNPPKTAAEDEEVRAKMERLKEKLGG